MCCKCPCSWQMCTKESRRGPERLHSNWQARRSPHEGWTFHGLKGWEWYGQNKQPLGQFQVAQVIQCGPCI